ncbi:MAG TPA: molybdopterin molybdotransferase MoeA, partial [Thermoplasmata archaeon]|nr:molybdopterin molybdotransferase MoeA [Thermoplasmata archaeon]
MKMRPFGDLLPVAQALHRLLAATVPVRRIESVPLEEAVGRRSARLVRARHPVPPFPRATWDGYALRARSSTGASRSGPVRLKLVGEVFAESPSRKPIHPGEAVAIATGGPLPPGADSVVIFEEVRVEGGEVVLSRPVTRGDRIADIGDDFPRGTPLVAPEELLTPPRLGTLAAAGEPSVAVWARPRVAIVPNGNELRRPGERLRSGAIHESNNASLAALAVGFGAVVTPHAPVPDDEGAIEAVLRRALQGTDLLLVTGGSSVGERDFLPSIFPRLGRMLFHGIAVRPGKPTLAVRAGPTLVIGMPGHPTSCLANGLWLV